MAEAIDIRVHIDEEPKPDDTCESCGVDSSHYAKHPTLHGGRCTRCGDLWLPGLRFEPPRRRRIGIMVKPTIDGGAILHLSDPDETKGGEQHMETPETPQTPAPDDQPNEGDSGGGDDAGSEQKD